MVKRFRLFVFGRVQGVFFRESARIEAEKLNLAGFAKNLPDGSVEILIQGTEEDLNRFIEWTRRGSDPANVSEVKVTEEKVEPNLEEFKVI